LMFSGFTLERLIKNGLKVGKNFSMEPDCFIDYSHCWLITIGDNVIFAPRVHVLAHDASMLNFLGYTKVGRVTIGNRVFVGNNAIINPNVSIGNDVIIGSGSIVTKDIPSDSVVAGNPARIICTTQEYIQKNKELLNENPNFSADYMIENGITEKMKEEMNEKLKGRIGFLGPFFNPE
jgi:maltose O-acetyltransferase